MKKIFLPLVAMLSFVSCVKNPEIVINPKNNPTPAPTTVTICNREWMIKNLDVSTYRNGDIIPQVADPAAWAALKTGAWCYYENIIENGHTYGKLYNWYAVNDLRGLAPSGWHIPSEDEFEAFEACLGGPNVAGGKLKETGNAHWNSPNVGANNNSGFTGLPGGYRILTGLFRNYGDMGYFWTTTLGAPGLGVYFGLASSDSGSSLGGTSAATGMSVRCVRDVQ